jgi:hypothetical protein
MGFFYGERRMDKVHKETLQVTKEIVVKFIETGRVSPANFEEIFPSVYTVVRRTLVDAQFSPNTIGDAPGNVPGSAFNSAEDEA